MGRRVVVTGMGVLSPLGMGSEVAWKACTEGRSGIHRIHRFEPTPFRTQIAGQIEEFDRSVYLDAKEIKRVRPVPPICPRGQSDGHRGLGTSDQRVPPGTCRRRRGYRISEVCSLSTGPSGRSWKEAPGRSLPSSSP